MAQQPPFKHDMTSVWSPLSKVEGVAEGAKAATTTKVQPKDKRFQLVSEIAAAKSAYALLVWQKGRLRHEEYWGEATANSRSESASMHKTVMALLFGAAIKAGHINSLDDPIERYVKEYRDDPRGKITLRNLLQMSSGLEPLSIKGGDKSPAWNFNFGRGDIMKMILGRALIAPPGRKFHYQSADTQLACVVLQRASGMAYRDFMSTKLWKPIGALDAYVWDYEAIGMPRCYAALLATANDWLRIGRLIKDRGLYNGKRVLAASWIDQMTTPAKTNPNYGLQIWLASPYLAKRYYTSDKSGVAVNASTPSLDPDMIYLDGFGGQRVFISRKYDLVIVRTGEARGDWDEFELSNAVIAAIGHSRP